MSKTKEIHWLEDVEDKDYEAAWSYLSLIYNDSFVKIAIDELTKVDVTKHKAKDIFRASGLPMLDALNHHVEKDRLKIQEDKKLSPILLVRDPYQSKVIIADGYHRLCAIYQYDEDAWIHCKIASEEC